MIHFISEGLGVQSTFMALAAKHGLIKPMPDIAVWADTGWEGQHVYDNFLWLQSVLPFPLVKVSSGKNIRDDHLANFDKRTTMPFALNDGISKSRAMQKCTAEYKAAPLERYMKEMLRERGICGRELPKTPEITQWRGISTDEAQRMKPASEPWYQTRFPLVMDLNYSRGQCLEWLHKHYPEQAKKIHRSSCIGCPNHGNEEWRHIKLNRPDEWKEAVELDKVIRKCGGLTMPAFLHRDGVPLDEADLSEDSTVDMFGNECFGMCGV